MRRWGWLFLCLTLIMSAGILAPAAPALSATPAVSISPKLGPPTTRFNVRGSGFGPTEIVDLRFDALLDAEREPILPREALGHGKLADMYWDTQASGTRIPPDVACELERIWRALVRRR